MSFDLESLNSILSPAGIPIDAELYSKIHKYMELLLFWNERIALTSLSREREILTFHFGECLTGLPFVGFGEGRLADVGSGAGFPGLVIAMLRPRLRVILLEPNKKKAAFLNEVIRALGLPGVNVATNSFQDSGIESMTLDYVTSRALGRLPKLLEWSAQVLKDSGRIILWTTEQDSAKLVCAKDWQWDAPVKIAESRHRIVLCGIHAKSR